METTLEEINNLVTFSRDEAGNLEVRNVEGNIWGSVGGSVYGTVKGNVYGNVRGDVVGNVEGDVTGIIWSKAQ